MTSPLVLVLSFASLTASRQIAKAGGAHVVLLADELRPAAALEARLALIERCDAVLLGAGLSRDVVRLAEHAKRHGRPVFYELGRAVEWIGRRVFS